MKTELFQYRDILDFSALFPTFNPVQTAAAGLLESDHNLVLSSPTGSGKTEIGEMYAAKCIKEGKKALFLFPFKAIAEEKFYERWSGPKHSFNKLSKIIMTGDYQLTDKRKAYLEKSSIVAATSEMLDHRTRNMKSEHSKWIMDVGVLVVDEAHLLTDGSATGDGRGHKLECAIMRFAQYNPGARIILLSATMPNVDELSNWLTTITGRKTDLYKSDYRPCVLTRHFVPYYDGGTAAQKKTMQMQKCVDVMKQNPHDQFLIFTAAKKWGRDFLFKLTSLGYKSDFHNADKRRDELSKIESGFRSGDIRALVATQTLGAGVNLPARRVIVPHVTYGRGEDVPVYEIHQKEGRSGRLGLDKEGDSYILIPQSNQNYHMDRIARGESIVSQMRNEIALTFHLLGEISYGNVTNLETAGQWYQRSFAYHQTNQLPQMPSLEQIFALLKKYKMVYWKDDEYHLTQLGKVCSMFYLHPIDVYNWFENFSAFFNLNNIPEEGSKTKDALIALCLSNIMSNQDKYIDTASIPPSNGDPEYVDFPTYQTLIYQSGIMNVISASDSSFQVGYLVYCLLNGLETGDVNYSVIKGLENDHERVLQAITTIDGMVTKWNQTPFWKMLNLRLNYKVPARYIELVKLDGVGKKIAYKLYNELGLKNAQDILANPEVVKKLGPKRGENVLTSAQKLVYNNNVQEELPLEGIHG